MRPLSSSRRRLLATYLTAGLGATVVVTGFALFATQQAGKMEAVEGARAKTEVLAAATSRHLTDGLLTGDDRAIAELDSVVRDAVLDRDVERVKIWADDGTVLYSDEPLLIGTVFPLGADQARILAQGGIQAGAADLTKPENGFELTEGELLEVYYPVTTLGGTPVLFEVYYRYDAVTESADRLWTRFAPIILGGLLLLALVELPLAWRLATRVEKDEAEKAALLQAAIDSSEMERHRIASDLHDGVVQDLSGISYSLAATAGTLATEGSAGAAPVAEAAHQTRTAVSALRSLLIEIYPPNLRDAGLPGALDGLLASLRSRRIKASVQADPSFRADPDTEALLYRSAQEALRNVVAHAQATTVAIRLTQDAQEVVLTITDDGIGVRPEQWANPRPGHAGLRLLSDLVKRAGGSFDLRAGDEGGTVLTVRLPSGG